MVFADCDQVNDTARFASALPIELDEVPSWPRLVCNRLPNRNLAHGQSPFRRDGNESKSPLKFGCADLRRHQDFFAVHAVVPVLLIVCPTLPVTSA